ncbi:hypothetical protein RND81_02G062100 [Saponaria officinalis]|uniref:Uncharacterized protein n=1 Tax=Saponaria officinalis TaxID=3572 RepID=A0AAW1MJT3_SAPOF
MVTLIAKHLKIDDPQGLFPLIGSPSYDFNGLRSVHMLSLLDLTLPSYYWHYGPRSIFYMRLPRAADSPLSSGPTARDFFVAPDADLAPAIAPDQGLGNAIFFPGEADYANGNAPVRRCARERSIRARLSLPSSAPTCTYAPTTID